MTDDRNNISGNKVGKSPKSQELEDEKEFFDLIGREHVDRDLEPEDVRSLVERIRSRKKAS